MAPPPATSKQQRAIAIPMSLSRCRQLTVYAALIAFLVAAPCGLSQAPNPCVTKGNGKYFCPDCSPSVASTSSRGAAFEANLLRLRDALRVMGAGNASFLNTTFLGAGDAEEDMVYGLATCLADAEMSSCAACLASAAAELPGTRCAGARAMVVWYPRCLVRYNNASFFGVADTSPERRYVVPNPNNFSNPAAMGMAREALGGRMLTATAKRPARFAFGEEQVLFALDEEHVDAANATLHGLAQCTEDLAPEECSRCLKSHVDWLGVRFAGVDGVRLNGASCYMRYDLKAFEPHTPPTMAPLIEPPLPPPSSSSLGGKKKLYILAGALGALVLCFLLLGAGGWLWYRKTKKRDSSSSRMTRTRLESLLRQHHQYPRRYRYAEVEQMTRSFAHKLGQGGNGTVYKGILPDGREVAVKMLTEDKVVDGVGFVNEVASISRTSHKNVVTLLGFCLEVSNSKMPGLIYEYMPNGSLDRYTVGGDDDGGGRWLSYDQLFDIVVGTAQGLEYLHHDCNAHIVHLDIKPHNILLDQNLRPKISDFGLAKLCQQKDSTISLAISNPGGTPGFMAPEVYSLVGPITSKSDIYSYGMTVLEKVGATRNINDSRTGESTSSTKYFPQWLYDDLDRFCATACRCDEADMEEVVRKMVVVGLWCIRKSPQDRPTMSRVVEMLEKKTTADELQLPPFEP